MKILIGILACVALFLPGSVMARKAGETRAEAASFSAKRFRRIDTNGDGQITPKEFLAYSATRARKKGRSLSRSAVYRRFHRMDRDSNGVVTAAEALAYDLARFDKADANGNGVIDPGEAS